MNPSVMNDPLSAAELETNPALPMDSTHCHTKHSVLLRRVLPFSGLLLALLLTGCARNYVITLTSGARITSRGKPKLQGATYVFKDAKGQPAQVSAGRVREIAPASMAREEGSQFFQ